MKAKPADPEFYTQWKYPCKMNTKELLFSDKQKLKGLHDKNAKWSFLGWKKITSDETWDFQEELKGTGNDKYMSKFNSLIFNLSFLKYISLH